MQYFLEDVVAFPTRTTLSDHLARRGIEWRKSMKTEQECADFDQFMRRDDPIFMKEYTKRMAQIANASQLQQLSQFKQRAKVEEASQAKVEEASQAKVEEASQAKVEEASQAKVVVAEDKFLLGLQSRFLKVGCFATCLYCENPAPLSKCPKTGDYHM
jgi:hypothetical protein